MMKSDDITPKESKTLILFYKQHMIKKSKVPIRQLRLSVRVKLWHVEHFPTDLDLRFRRDGTEIIAVLAPELENAWSLSLV